MSNQVTRSEAEVATRMGGLLAAIKALPSLPSGLEKLLSLDQGDPNYFEEASAVIRGDAALAGQVLRIANSALYSGEAKAESLDEALMRVGIRRVAAIVVSMYLRQGLPKASGASVDIWLAAVVSAVLCRAVADNAATLGVAPETAYTYGLLHDAGRLVLAAIFPEATLQLLKEHATPTGRLLPIEREIYGATHDTAGRLIGNRWNFPTNLTLVMAAHHLPPARRSGLPAAVNRMIDLVCLGDHLAQIVLEAGAAGQEPAAAGLRAAQDELPALFADRLGIDPQVPGRAVEVGLAEAAQQCRLLGVPIAGETLRLSP